MKKFVAFLLINSFILLLIACQPTIETPNSTFSESEPEMNEETAIPPKPIETNEPEAEPDPTTAVSTNTPQPTSTRSTEFTAEPLPTLSLEEQPMSENPGNVVKSSAEAHPEAVNIATQDLSDRLDVDESEIEVVTVEMVIWPDASMGCPHPDMAYKQVPQDGLRIRLEVDGTLYNYHSGGNRPPTLCENPAKLNPAPGSEDMAPPPSLDDT